MVQFLADENIPRDVVTALRNAGLDVFWIAENFAGLPDRGVLEKAVTEQRVLLTFDKDFGELVFRGDYPAVGVVLFRIPSTMPIAAMVVLVRMVLLNREGLVGTFTVVEQGRIRHVRLPAVPDARSSDSSS